MRNFTIFEKRWDKEEVPYKKSGDRWTATKQKIKEFSIEPSDLFRQVLIFEDSQKVSPRLESSKRSIVRLSTIYSNHLDLKTLLLLNER